MLKADVPGVDEKDLDIAVHNGVLTVSGIAQAEERKEGESFALYERQYGSFTPQLRAARHGRRRAHRGQARRTAS